jgi:hypothetical protein
MYDAGFSSMMKQSGIIRVEKPSNILVTIIRANNICEQTLGKVAEVSFSLSLGADYLSFASFSKRRKFFGSFFTERTRFLKIERFKYMHQL